MNDKQKQPAARPILRWLAAINIPVFVVMAGVCMFGILDGKPNIFMTFVFTYGAVMFASITATGRIEPSPTMPFQLFAAAKKFADDEITLEEYGSRTKELLQGK